jgi:hypothetical protein
VQEFNENDVSKLSHPSEDARLPRNETADTTENMNKTMPGKLDLKNNMTSESKVDSRDPEKIFGEKLGKMVKRSSSNAKLKSQIEIGDGIESRSMHSIRLPPQITHFPTSKNIERSFRDESQGRETAAIQG